MVSTMPLLVNLSDVVTGSTEYGRVRWTVLGTRIFTPEFFCMVIIGGSIFFLVISEVSQ